MGRPLSLGLTDLFSGGFSDNRKAASMIKAGETALLGLQFSVTEGFQNVFKNGVSILSGPRSSPTNANGSFFFPANNAASGWGSDWTLGEMIVSRGAVEPRHPPKNGRLSCPKMEAQRLDAYYPSLFIRLP